VECLHLERALDRFGNDAIGAVSVTRPLAGQVEGSLQVKAFHKARSRYLGETVPSTGGMTVYVTPGLRWSSASRLTLYGFVLVPAYRYVNEAQPAPRLALLLGVSRTFGP
jgi:hypothetical protein